MNALEITPNQTQVCVYRPSALDERDRLILESADIEKVDDQFSMAEAVDVCRRLRKMLADVEKTRKLVKEQPLELCRAIDAKAKEFVGPISTELDRLSGAAGAYQREQERIAAEAERKQREEAQRLQREAEEAERRRQEEAQRLARAAREAQEAEQTAFNEAEKNAATLAQAEAELRAQQAKEEAAQAAQAAQASTMKPAIKPKKHEGLSMRDEPRYRITDIAAVALAHPDYVSIEPKPAVIRQAIQAGLLVCPGMEIWMESVPVIRKS